MTASWIWTRTAKTARPALRQARQLLPVICVGSTLGQSTYAGAVSSNLTNIVKTAVASSIKEQRRFDRSKASIVMYSVVEDRNDSVYAHKILSAIDFDLQIDGCIRLGSPRPTSTTGSPKPHPFKVELSTTADCVLVLNTANMHRNKLRSLEINISPLLQADELNKLKSSGCSVRN